MVTGVKEDLNMVWIENWPDKNSKRTLNISMSKKLK